jgi:hypothetical protein
MKVIAHQFYEQQFCSEPCDFLTLYLSLKSMLTLCVNPIPMTPTKAPWSVGFQVMFYQTH